MERLNDGEVLVGDGGMVHVLEKRGYVKAGLWTPECTVKHPEAGQLVCHKESIEIAKQSFVIRSFFAYYYFFVFFSLPSCVSRKYPYPPLKKSMKFVG